METNFDINPPSDIEIYDESIRLFTVSYEQMFITSKAYLQSLLEDFADVLVVGAGTGMEICSYASTNTTWAFDGVEPVKTDA